MVKLHRLVNQLTAFKCLSLFNFIILSAGLTTESPDDSVRGPIFLSEPPPVSVILNTKGAVITCSAYGNPSPTVTWINSEGVEVHNRSGIVEVLNNSSLYFLPFDANNVVPADYTQIYRCVARNRIGTVISRKVHTTAVIVEQLEKFTVNVHDVWVMRGGTAVFKCEVNPPFWNDYVNITGWLQGSVRIQSGDRISINPDGKLHIWDVRDTDGYMHFQCIGTSSLAGGVERSSNLAKLSIHDPPAGGTAPTIDVNSLPMIEVDVGGTTELPCVADGWPLPTYRWYKQGVALSVSSGQRFSQYGGNLMIRQAQLIDAGEYQCNVTNPRGSSSVVRLLIVKAKIIISIAPITQIVDSDRSATLNCSVSWYHNRNIIWYKDGQQLLADDRHVFVTDTLLEIKSVRRQDQGMYQCVAIEKVDETQATAQLLLGAAKPTILDAFGNQYVQVGQRTSVRCVASGNPTPTVKWTLDDEPLKDRSRLSLAEFVTPDGDVFSYVNITSVSLLEGGDYRCVATNKVGENSHVSRMNVYGIPYIREMRNVTATANEKLSLKCYVTGYPIQSITWHRNGRQLPINHLQQVVNGTLNILKVQKLYDAGEYTCAATNLADQRMNRSVYISVLEPPAIDAFSIQPRKQGDRVTMSCAVSRGDLPIYINWTKDDLPIPPDIGVFVEASGPYGSLLKIGDVSPVHDGNYTCHAHNAAASTSYTAVLHVNVPPTWLIQPEDSFVVRKQSVQLDCSVTGIPQPNVTWNIKDIVLDELYSLDLSKSDKYLMFDNGTLVIKSTTEEDQGHYLCRADNNIGHGISKIIYLTVRVPARFEASQKNYTVLRGQNVTMDCMAIGDKPISVTWNFKNQTVGSGTYNSRFTVGDRLTSRGKLSQISLHPALRDDTGIYGCTAANDFGYDFMSLYLTVFELPDAPGNLTLLDKGSQFVILAWSRPFDGNYPLLEYIIEYQNTTGEERSPIMNMSVNGDALTAKVENLHPSFLYNFRVRAMNSIGLGLTSHQLSLKMLEEAPNGPPLDVEVIALGSEKLQVTWKPPAIENRNGVILGYYIGYQDTQTEGQMQVIHKDIDTKTDDPDEDVSVIVSNLKKFTEYVINVKSYNKQGHGPSSPDIKVTTLEDVPSQPPENVRGYAVNSQVISVAWNPPPLFTLHGVLQGYKILYKTLRKDEDETDANFMKSTTLEVTLSNLEKFTNYSIQVLAYTRKGEGVRSNPIHIRTLEDVPGRPRGIKAAPVNSKNIMTSWQPPDNPNGELTAYNIYYSNTSTSAQEMKIDVSPLLTFFLLQELETSVNYWVRVTASTRVGEGESTQIVTVMPSSPAPAKISSFSKEVKVSWQAAVMLPCLAVGDPEPNVIWSSQYAMAWDNEKYSVQQNGSLYIASVTGADANNYTCKAENIHGIDVITYSLSVQVDDKSQRPPKAPVLSLAAVTSSTVQVSWLSGSNGGSPILGFLLRYRKEQDIWQEVHLGPKNRSFTASGLLCGTAYKFVIYAINIIDKSESSNAVSSKTDGSAPILPPQNKILKSINSTSIELDLQSWEKDVCLIQFYSIQYQVWGESQWVQVANKINWNTTIYTIEDLHTATWYIMKITAYNDAGHTDCNIKFATLTFSGSTLEPLSVIHKDDSYFYEKLYIMVPMCTTFVVLVVVSVGVALFCFRRRQIIRYKENNTDMRRDITTETSLMNDLDKRITYEIESPNDSRFNCRNVNLLISLTADENQSGNSGWSFHDSSKTTSDNASLERFGDDANINPYATFNELKLVFNDNSTYHVPEPDSDDDSVSLEKAEAQKAMQRLSDNRDGSKFLSKPNEAQPTAEKHSYDNQAMVLSPRKYASADQIHALFAMAPPRPQSAYSKNRSQGTRSTPTDKGSQRHSLISSVTTVSSSRDELMEAFENLNRNPPPPVVYETEADSLSQPTDSSSTEPGICLFTESPPQPNERREASCEVPRYEFSEESRYKDSQLVPKKHVTPMQESPIRHNDTMETRSGSKKSITSSAQKSKESKENCFKEPSSNRSNTRPRCIEEVTYVFTDDKSPVRTRKPQSLEEKLRSAREEFGTSVWRKGGRRTPHARTRYDTTIQTPGTAENKPLVFSQLMSVQDETPEEEEAVSLMDRLYRPVAARRSRDALTSDEHNDDDYTEHFTIV